MIASLRRDGYAHLRGVVPSAWIDRANRAIDADLRDRYDPARRAEYDHRSACPDLRGAPVIDGLLDPVRPLLEPILGWSDLEGRRGAQIAIRWARERRRPIAPTWHIDGVPTAHNGVAGPALETFTCLVGVFLTATPGPFAGNFTVWPGSQRALARWFEEGGPARLRAGRPLIDPGAPRQLITAPGDVVIANYLLAHGAAVNTSDVQRRAVFFRLALPDLAADRHRRMCDPWDGWSLRDPTPPRG